MIFSGKNGEDDTFTMEILELKGHKFFMGVQFHPELRAKPFDTHPIIDELVSQSFKNKNN